MRGCNKGVSEVQRDLRVRGSRCWLLHGVKQREIRGEGGRGRGLRGRRGEIRGEKKFRCDLTCVHPHREVIPAVLGLFTHSLVEHSRGACPAFSRLHTIPHIHLHAN